MEKIQIGTIYLIEMSNLDNNKNSFPKIKIWTLVGVFYIPIIFVALILTLPKVEWKYVFESASSKLARHHKEAEGYGYPGIPYISNTGTSRNIYVSESDIAYGECGWNFYCIPEELNTKKGVHYLPVNLPFRRIKENVVKLGKSYYCNKFEISGAGECTSGGWKYGTER